MFMVIVVRFVLLFVVVLVVDLIYIVVGVVLIRLEKMLFSELVVSVLLLLIICLFLFSRLVCFVIVWIVMVVLNIVVIISVSMFGRMIGFNVFIIFRLLISELLFLLFNEGMVKMLEKWMLGLKSKFIIEMLIMVNRMLLGIFSFFRLRIIVRFISDIIIGKVLKLFSVIGRLFSGFLMIRLMLLVVISNKNRLILILVLWVMFCGKLCKIQL